MDRSTSDTLTKLLGPFHGCAFFQSQRLCRFYHFLFSPQALTNERADSIKRPTLVFTPGTLHQNDNAQVMPPESFGHSVILSC